MFMNKKGMTAEMIGIIGATVVILLFVYFQVGILDKTGEKVTTTFDKYTCTWSDDGEGSYYIQEVIGDCPCDFDEPKNSDGTDKLGYVGKSYEVKKEIYDVGGMAEKLLVKEYVKNRREEGRFTINQKDLTAITDYLDDTLTAKKGEAGNLYLSWEWNLFQENQQPSTTAFCKDGGVQTKNGRECPPELFMETWLKDGLKTKAECATSEFDCLKKYAPECNKKK